MAVDGRGLFSCSVFQGRCEDICCNLRRRMGNSTHSAFGVQITRVGLLRAVGRPSNEAGLDSLV